MSLDDYLNNILEETCNTDRIKPLKNLQKQENLLENIKRKKLRGGYRPVLISEAQLVDESNNLRSKFEIINSPTVLDKNFLTPQDIVSYYIICYLDQRYPNQLLENFSPLTNKKVKSELLSNLNFQLRNKKVMLRITKYDVKTLFDVVNSFNLHSVPMTARNTLVNWYLGKYNLNLFVNQIPSSREVLRLQAQAKRCVSLIADKINCLVLNERDPLSFLIHDLVHAYKMFSNEYLMKGQVGFYKAVVKLYNNSVTKDFLDNMCLNDEVFKDEFDYLIADMNSHPRHLFYYFKAILINGFKRKVKLEKNEFLSGDSLREFNYIFDSILDTFDMNETEKNLSRKIIFEENHKKQNNIDNSLNFYHSLDFTLLDNFFTNFKE